MLRGFVGRFLKGLESLPFAAVSFQLPMKSRMSVRALEVPFSDKELGWAEFRAVSCSHETGNSAFPLRTIS